MVIKGSEENQCKAPFTVEIEYGAQIDDQGLAKEQINLQKG